MIRNESLDKAKALYEAHAGRHLFIQSSMLKEIIDLAESGLEQEHVEELEKQNHEMLETLETLIKYKPIVHIGMHKCYYPVSPSREWEKDFDRAQEVVDSAKLGRNTTNEERKPLNFGPGSRVVPECEKIDTACEQEPTDPNYPKRRPDSKARQAVNVANGKPKIEKDKP